MFRVTEIGPNALKMLETGIGLEKIFADQRTPCERRNIDDHTIAVQLDPMIGVGNQPVANGAKR